MSPDERTQSENEEMAPLNADNLDADQLDQQALEDVAGGVDRGSGETGETEPINPEFGCTNNSCGINW